MKTLILLICLTLTACASAPATAPPTYTPNPTYTPYPTPNPHQAFTNALYTQIDADDTLHPSAKLALANLFTNTATVLFDAGNGLILQFNILDVPPNQHETSLAATQLFTLGRAVATHHNITLGGIEVIFFAGEQAPFIGFLSQPPWDYKDILVVPLSSEYIRKLAEKDQIPGPATPDPARAFLKAVQDRVDVDDSIPSPGRNAIIALYGNEPTFAFPDNKGIVL